MLYLHGQQHLELRLMGAFQLTLNGQLVVPEKQLRKADALFAYLALNPNVRHQRTLLIDRFCANTRDPASDFRGVLNRVRNILGKGQSTDPYFSITNVHGDGALVFEPTPSLWVDALAFQQPIQYPTLERLIEQAKLYRGAFMAGYEDLDCSDWIETMRATLEAQFDTVMKALLDSLFEQARWKDVLVWAEHWITYNFTARDAYVGLMEAHSELGNLPKLDESYARLQRAMTTIDPSLVNDFKRQYDYWRKLLVEGYGKTQWTRREQDKLAASEEVKPRLPKPLPRPPTDFVGRNADLERIQAKLSEAGCQLLTLMGIGGVGKTRLALQIGTRILQQVAYDTSADEGAFPDGVCFVETASIQSAETFATALADALNFVPYGQEPLIQQIRNYLREKRVLILFDAFEHLLAEPRSLQLDGVAILHDLLASAPGVKALVTSREWLGDSLEHRLTVEGLDYPQDLQGDTPIENYSAVQLFLRTARRVRASFSIEEEREGVLRICQQVEGLPLAIDLAAVQIESMTAAEIAWGIGTNLDLLSSPDSKLDPRHRSIRATFEYTWQELTNDQQRIFAQLSVFGGGFSRDAALFVTQAPRRALNGLVSAALLRYDFKEGRYDLHDLLRQFGSEKLKEFQDASVTLSVRMADFYLDYGHQHPREFHMLEPEWGNFLAAMRASVEGQRWPVVLDFAQTLSEAWFTRARFTDARQGFAWARDAAQRTANQPALARALCDLGKACIEQGAYEDAWNHLSESLTLFETHNNLKGIADAKYLLAWASFERGDLSQSHQLMRSCQAHFTDLGHTEGMAQAQHGLARIAFSERNYDEAVALDVAALAQLENTNNVKAVCQILCYLTFAYGYLQNFEQAHICCQREIELSQSIQDLGEIALAQFTMSELCLQTGSFDEARTHAQQSIKLLMVIGDRKTTANAIFNLCCIDIKRRDLESALSSGYRSIKIYEELQDERSLVRPLLFTGDILLNLGQRDQAEATWLRAQELAERIQHPQQEAILKRLKDLANE